jgi:hypothetical protein
MSSVARDEYIPLCHDIYYSNILFLLGLLFLNTLATFA